MLVSHTKKKPRVKVQATSRPKTENAAATGGAVELAAPPGEETAVSPVEASAVAEPSNGQPLSGEAKPPTPKEDRETNAADVESAAKQSPVVAADVESASKKALEADAPPGVDAKPVERVAVLSLGDNARCVLEARYLAKDDDGKVVETPEQLFGRVARVVGEVEARHGASPAETQAWINRYYNLMATGDFMPNSPTLMNAGRSMGMLSACFVLPVEDSIDGIFTAIKNTALIQKAGGGTGFDFSRLRPSGDVVRSSGGTTSGPLSFLRVFSKATDAIQQGAFRRGANMGMMRIDHPDILSFIRVKDDLGELNNYNLSVSVTTDFMDRLAEDPGQPHLVTNPRTGRSAPLEKLGGAGFHTLGEVWDVIVDHAWRTGEPGVVFIDRVNEANPTPHVGRIEATNPCGEQPLLPYEACNLGSINLRRFVKPGGGGSPSLDWDRLREVTHVCTRFLDDVVDANRYPLPEIEAVCRANRKIGLGVMGFADALFAMGIPYDSAAGVALGERVMKLLGDESHNASQALAHSRGSFPNWAGSVWDTVHHRPMRNACTTTVAPTGTISIISGCSGGVEPLFSFAFTRNVLEGRQLTEVHQGFLAVAHEHGFFSETLARRLAETGSARALPEVPAEVADYAACAHDVSPEWHVRMQAAFQKHCDASISKTINFSHDATAADIRETYRLAWRLGCKGITVYRDGCRQSQPMALNSVEAKTSVDAENTVATRAEPESPASTPAVDKRSDSAAAETPAGDTLATKLPEHIEEAAIKEPAVGEPTIKGPAIGGPAIVKPTAPAKKPVAKPSTPSAEEPKSASEWRMGGGDFVELDQNGLPVNLIPVTLPDVVPCIRVRQRTPFGNMHIKISVEPHTEREREVFAQLGRGGDVASSDLEAICRMVSLFLRCNGTLIQILHQFEGIGSTLNIATKDGRVMSLADGLAKGIRKYLRVKERFGLHPLLLGKVTREELNEVSREMKNGESSPRSDTGPFTVHGIHAQHKIKCPECNGALSFESGCVMCHGCGFSRC